MKIELNTADELEIPRLIEVARSRAPGIPVTAEKLETIADFKRCVDLGFDLFQGWCVGRPELLRRPARPVNAAAARALHHELTGGGAVDVDRCRTIVATDALLAFRLLAPSTPARSVSTGV